MAVTTVRGIGFLRGGGAASNAGFGAGAEGGVYGVYIEGGELAVSAVVTGAALTAPQTDANSRAAAVRSARSKRLRQRGHHVGSPASRAPQFGHSSTRTLSAQPAPKLSLKRVPSEADSRGVNVVLVPALILLLGLVVYKKVIEPRSKGERTPKAGKAPKASKAGKAPKASKPEKAPKPGKAPKEKARATVTSSRMGSVL